MAFALVMAAAARSGLEAPREIEIKIWVDPPYTPTLPPPAFAPPHGGRTPDDGRSPVEPTPPGRPFVDQPIDRPTFDPGGEPGVRAERPTGGGEEGERLLPAPPADPGVDPNIPVESYDVPPVPIVAPEPPYDDMPREAGIEGKVVLEALVTWEGFVREVRVREGNPMLAVPAVKTVKTWRFRPARSQGRAVSCWVSIPIVFRLH